MTVKQVRIPIIDPSSMEAVKAYDAAMDAWRDGKGPRPEGPAPKLVSTGTRVMDVTMDAWRDKGPRPDVFERCYRLASAVEGGVRALDRPGRPSREFPTIMVTLTATGWMAEAVDKQHPNVMYGATDFDFKSPEAALVALEAALERNRQECLNRLECLGTKDEQHREAVGMLRDPDTIVFVRFP